MALVFVVSSGVGGWLFYELDHRPLEVSAPPEILEVPRGGSLHAISRGLESRGWIPGSTRLALRIYGRLSDISGELKAGEYVVEQGMSVRQLLARIRAGRVKLHRLTVVEGWTFARLRQELGQHEAVEQTLDGVEDEQIMEELGLEASHPEGMFFPTTYRFPRGATDRDLLRVAARQMRQELARVWSERHPEVPLDEPYQALILASIIERETGRDDERRKVAGVFTRRLEQGMRLQTDPTVIYGLGDDYDGRLRRADLRRDTPYNTYTRHGLPPTPIALPGRASLEAAVDPKPGSALYFVSRGDGSHHFSDTLDEHNQAVRRYILEEK
ncbi:endolytic transglycosylase MltG [Halorhodospira halophila]|uniref:Endolytic murein transglycosylase n=1 Tax=Halorhodospira halophila (strain DSM 244 / SL1) TaxID=349124 RepID=A1WSY8_HALHL|nr:endolytic transglycosylase MltG [Halorhodospira halophila]ABM60800.1 aminodeoxychorismate lyase [Halorhodospira halophila SL1]MBK1728455.1 aminodeoxychorismate lyase [Halorhodospira halophila]